jgi:hypothetical protein
LNNVRVLIDLAVYCLILDALKVEFSSGSAITSPL